MAFRAPPTDSLTDEQKLNLDEIKAARNRSAIDGVVSGVAAGFLSGQVSIRLFKQSRNAGLLSGLLAGVGVGYLISQESLRLQLIKSQQANASLREHMAKQSAATAESSAAIWDLNRGEGGAPGTGLEVMEDKYNSASGDH